MSVTPPHRLRRTFVLLSAGTLLVFAVLLATLTLLLRSSLRDEVLQRESNAIYAVARMEISAATARLTKLGVPVTTADVFAGVLESSRLGGVLAVQLFDSTGTLRQSLPSISSDAPAAAAWWPRELTKPVSVFYARGSLEAVYGVGPELGKDATITPLFEVALPLPRSTRSADPGVAHYWMDGAPIQEEFRRMDRRLAAQSGIAFAGGAALVLLLLAWTYRRLADANARLLAQSADLVRANQELDFAAKTGALGAISAHLIHGLKNPLAGLEGFVADAASAPGDIRGEAQQTAMETARRLRTMVNDVVTVLRDEASGAADYRVPLREALDGVVTRAASTASAAGVAIEPVLTSDACLQARTANLVGLVLANLLANAVEASPRGSRIRLEAGCSAEHIDFLVTDSGTGLPEGVRESLFRPVRSSKPGGGGMGLAISHRLARHAGGELSLVRSDASGTTFRLTVPHLIS